MMTFGYVTAKYEVTAERLGYTSSTFLYFHLPLGEVACSYGAP